MEVSGQFLSLATLTHEKEFSLPVAYMHEPGRMTELVWAF
jgi:hypothetical protein